jgi:hypothetical protein
MVMKNNANHQRRDDSTISTCSLSNYTPIRKTTSRLEQLYQKGKKDGRHELQRYKREKGLNT